MVDIGANMNDQKKIVIIIVLKVSIESSSSSDSEEDLDTLTNIETYRRKIPRLKNYVEEVMWKKWYLDGEMMNLNHILGNNEFSFNNL